MQEKVYQTHIVNMDELKHRLVQVWAELLDHRHHRCRTAAMPSQCVLLVCESSGGGDILKNICVEFTCGPLGYLLNSWPV